MVCIFKIIKKIDKKNFKKKYIISNYFKIIPNDEIEYEKGKLLV